jgi:hypothetical protein
MSNKDMPFEPSTGPAGDYDYVIRIIQYLDLHFGIRFFISSRDFDVLYRWWEKRIPQAVIRDSLARVVARRRAHDKKIASFSVFSNEVRRNYQSFLALDIGRERSGPENEYAEIDHFLAAFPAALGFAKDDFAVLFAGRRRKEETDPGPLEEKLLAHFQGDSELNARTAWFLGNLSPQLRRPEIERRYRLNYLYGKFAVPAFD